MMSYVEFAQRFGFKPNIHEERLFRGLDPLDESKPYDPANYHGQTLAQYHAIWSRRGSPPLVVPPFMGAGDQAAQGLDPMNRVTTSTSGPGTELKAILATLGITHQPGCDCNAKAAQMDAWGVAGCRSNFNQIVVWMRDGAPRWGWVAKIMAGAKAVKSGLALQVNWVDPFPSLITLAIERADGVSREDAKTRRGQKLILVNGQSPGDLCTLTAAIESLHATYPGEYLTDVRTPCPDIFVGNPHITPIADGDPDARRINLGYPTINRSNQTLVSFLSGMTTDLGNQLGRPLELTTNRPHLYLSVAEASRLSAFLAELNPTEAGRLSHSQKPLWIVNAGIKSDFTLKQWPVEYFQEVIAKTSDRIQWAQIGNADHDHPQLNNVIDLRGRTTARQLMRLVAAAKGGLGPVTWLQHLCAGFEKPYVCLLGGREPVAWTQYQRQRTLHTIGSSIPCCQSGACWRSRVVPLGDKINGKPNPADSSLCQYPITSMQKPVGYCMAAIKPTEVIHAIEGFL
jgi:hypothetical protein